MEIQWIFNEYSLNEYSLNEDSMKIQIETDTNIGLLFSMNIH